MERIFEKRRLDYKTSEDSKPVADRLKVHHAGGSEVRHELDDRTRSRNLGLAAVQRPKNKVVEELWNRSRLSGDASGEKQSLKSMRNTTLREESNRQILEDLRPNHDGQRRSTRASAYFAKPSKDPFDDLEDLPKVARYSKTHGLGQPWKKPLTYPRLGKKKTTVEFSDLERLDEGEYLNDSLISFYLRFLEHTIEQHRPDLAKRVYFFNTFFFATLMNTHKGRKGFNYEGVQKWTRNVDLFTYDYIVIPINDTLHWYLAIICNLPALDRGLVQSDEKADPPMDLASDLTGNTEEDGPPSSSPTVNLREGDSVTLVEGTKEPDERGARDSFADLSLDVHAVQPTAQVASEIQQAEASKMVEEDQEMLDGQLQRAMLGSTMLNMGEDNIKGKGDGPVEDLDRPPKAAGGSKRGKRKSMPSVTKSDPDKPAIITFDSLGLARSSTVRILKDYLREEAKAKRGGMEFEAGQIKGITANMIPLQENWYDCGLFLLGYVGKLLEDDPKDFITKVIKRQYNVQEDWPNLKPSLARKNIREQLLKLHKEQEAERLKEKDAPKDGLPNLKPGSEIDTDLSRAVSPARANQPEAREDQVEAQVPAEDPKAPRSPVRPTTRDHALKTALSLPPYDFERDIESLIEIHGNDKIDEASIHEPGQEPEVQQPRKRSLSHGTFEDVKRPAKMPGSFEDEPSLIIVESESQQEEAPRSFQQSHPSQATHASADHHPQPELPAEIQDSQPSEPSRHVAEISRRTSDPAEPPAAKRWDVQEVQAVLVENTREHKRRKIDHEAVATAPTSPRAARKAHVSGTAKEIDALLPEWAIQGSSRRKGQAGKVVGRGKEVINID